jgi:hypothetical protein
LPSEQEHVVDRDERRLDALARSARKVYVMPDRHQDRMLPLQLVSIGGGGASAGIGNAIPEQY